MITDNQDAIAFMGSHAPVIRCPRAVWCLALLLFLAVHATSAIVSPLGYTNAFGTQPPAADWATFSAAGAGTDNYTVDADVNANITSSGITSQTASAGGNPPAANVNATWSSSGLYLQTRPTANRYTSLMGKFVNNTGTNATQITLSYILTIAGSAGVLEEDEKGTRVYYSLNGATNSWTNIASLNQTLSANGPVIQSASVALNWTNGGSLFLLWVDDNAAGAGIDSANQLDNLSLRVISGTPAPFVCTLTFPANNAVFVSGAAIVTSTTVTNGAPPYAVEYFTNRGLGNTIFASAGTSGVAPFNVSLGNLSSGSYNIFAVATDSRGSAASRRSMTNTFFVADPIILTLTAPTNNAFFDNTNVIKASATVSGGSAPYSVQFYLDNAPHGSPVISPPYERNIGSLFVGDHTVRATVTDTRGWVSNSFVSTIHIDGPFAAMLTPTNGSSFVYGQSVTLTAAVDGGVSPYATAFYVDDQLVASLSSPPFTTNLGLLPAGSYTSYVHVSDTSLPAPQQTSSGTNVFTILPNPLVVSMASPTSGTAGLAFTLTASATVSAPLTVTNVEFFLDEMPVGVDNTAPYSVLITNPTAGAHGVYAVAKDNLGRISYSVGSTVTFIIDPLANDDFINRFLVAGTAVRVAGANVGATTEFGEPFQIGVNRWGKTLWWKWTAPTSGVVTINTIGSSFNTFLGIYTGMTVNALTVIGQNDNSSLAGAGASSVTFDALRGIEYEIQVGGVFTGGGGGSPAVGDIELSVAMLPSVTVTSPSNGTIYPVGSSIAVSVTALSFAGAITNVSLYRGAVFVGSATGAPYSFVASNAPAGTNYFYAVAVDSLGQVGTSAVVRVLVANDGITITSPSEGAIFSAANPITISAFPMLVSGSMTNVSFFVDGQLVGRDSIAPFSVVWNSITSGPHQLTANGMDNSGNIYYATPVFVSVGRTFFPAHSVWKYLDNGSNQGTNWRAPGFDDTVWRSGVAELGYGDGDETTEVEDNATPGYNSFDTFRYMTTYFRRNFTVANAASYAGLLMNVKYDDGAVVYLNGQEAARFNMNTGAVTYLATALFAGDDGDNFVPVTVPASFLVDGTNSVAVEVHQSTSDSTDLSFDMDLLGLPLAVVAPKIDSIALAQTNIIVSFRADANVSYILEHATALDDWQTLQMIGASPTNRAIQVTRAASEPGRVFRLRSP